MVVKSTGAGEAARRSECQTEYVVVAAVVAAAADLLVYLQHAASLTDALVSVLPHEENPRPYPDGQLRISPCGNDRIAKNTADCNVWRLD